MNTELLEALTKLTAAGFVIEFDSDKHSRIFNCTVWKVVKGSKQQICYAFDPLRLRGNDSTYPLIRHLNSIEYYFQRLEQ